MTTIDWSMDGAAIEAESFRRIEVEAGAHGLPLRHWRVARRLVHTCADFSIVPDLRFHRDPVAAGLAALRGHAPIYCDSNMIRAGLSRARLRAASPAYADADLHCLVADAAVAAEAKARGVARSLVAVERSLPLIDGAVCLIGNAPLALAAIARAVAEGQARPRLVIGMPVGFVHVVESKELLLEQDVPAIVLAGRRGGSALAVAALHAILESLDGADA